MSSSHSATASVSIRRFHSPKTMIGRFITRRTLRAAALWAIVFGGYVASKAVGFVDLYPTMAARQKIAETFSNNVGIELMLGRAPHSATTAAYVAWNTGGIMVVIGAIWGLLLATKYFRGEEDAGRWEILLSGQTTARRAVINVFSGLAASLGVFYIILATLFIAISKSHGVNFSTHASLLFALTVVLGITLFICIGALMSQLMPTRSRAAGVSAVILGICFLIRAMGDVTTLHWLLPITPLGWVEKLQPLSNSQPLWLIPFVALIIITSILTVFFAGKRDLGDSIIADKATARPRLRLLNSPVGAALRLTRSNSAGWLAGIFMTALLFGLITKSTAQVFSQSKNFEKAISRLAQQSRLSSALAFLGIVFFLEMVLIMAYAASSIAAVRRDEADGYVDNFLVRPVSRIRWLSGRLLLIGGVIVGAGLLTMIALWVGLASEHMNISLHTLVLASINALVPAMLTLSVGVLAFGFRPRLTSFMAYGVLAWSFLVETVSSGLNFNHWIVDTSILHQIALAPAANPQWKTDGIVVAIAVVLCLIGALRFVRRDLETE